jgi:hypothetical protein
MSEVKVKLSLCLTKHHATKAYGGVVAYLHTFLAMALGTGVTKKRRACGVPNLVLMQSFIRLYILLSRVLKET